MLKSFRKVCNFAITSYAASCPHVKTAGLTGRRAGLVEAGPGLVPGISPGLLPVAVSTGVHKPWSDPVIGET